MKISTLESWSWPARIRWAAKADKAGRYRGTKVEKWMDKQARDWPTCACGQLDERIPHCSDGEPLDDDLFHFGEKFYAAVYCLTWPIALDLINQIEARAVKVLRELKA